MKVNLFPVRYTLLSLFLASASAGERELLIPLKTRSFLEPITLIAPRSSPFSASYLRELMGVLTFDLNHNGSLVAQEKGESLFEVELQIDGEGALLAFVTSKEEERIQSAGPYLLTGKLERDRSKLHCCADRITEIATGKRGIASLKILYALQSSQEGAEGREWRSEIWQCDSDGAQQKQLTYEQSYCITPACFPVKGEVTAHSFLYVNYKKGQPKIYKGSFERGTGEPLLPLRGNQLLPTLSCQGDLLAFISDAGGRADLFIQHFSPHVGLLGKPIQTFSYPFSVQASPTFHPSGKQIAFVSDKEKTARIYLIDVPDLKKKFFPKPLCISKKYYHNTCPSWSEDGTKLAYSAMIDGTRQIVIYDLLTQEEEQLTFGKGHKENPSWAPNSLHIVYNTAEPTSSELFMINIKQRKAMQITNGAGKKHYPTWELGGWER